MGNLAAPSVVQAAWSLLARYYASSGALAACGGAPLSTNPDTDLLVLSACSKVGGQGGGWAGGGVAAPHSLRCLQLRQLRLFMQQRPPPPPPLPNRR